MGIKKRFMWINDKGRYIMIHYYASTPSTRQHYFVESSSITVDYSKYHKWMEESISNNNKCVREKELKYLYNTYDKLCESVKSEFNTNKYMLELDKINKSTKRKSQFKGFMLRTVKEYGSIDEKREDNYQFYDNLGSWYKLKLELTDKIIHSLNKKTECEIESCKNQKCIINVEYKEGNNLQAVVFVK